MITIKYPDNTQWPTIIKSVMPLSQFQRRFNLKGDGRIVAMSKSKRLPFDLVVFVSGAIEEIITEQKDVLREISR